MSKLFKMVSLLLAFCLLCGIPFRSTAEEEVIDANLTCTITLGNWPPDTAPEAEKALFENYRAIMAKETGKDPGEIPVDEVLKAHPVPAGIDFRMSGYQPH